MRENDKREYKKAEARKIMNAVNLMYKNGWSFADTERETGIPYAKLYYYARCKMAKKWKAARSKTYPDGTMLVRKVTSLTLPEEVAKDIEKRQKELNTCFASLVANCLILDYHRRTGRPAGEGNYVAAPKKDGFLNRLKQLFRRDR